MAKLLSLDTVYADGYHNAFTDLLKWKGHYYLTFRTSDTHGFPPNGDTVVMRSADLKSWETCAEISTGGDDRDPKLIDAGDHLGIVFGTWYPRWHDDSIPNGPSDLISQVTLSRDGLCWCAPKQLYSPNYWLWRILPAEGAYYCAAYHFPIRSDYDKRTVHLLRSEDLYDWRLVCQMRIGGGPGEPVLYQPEPDALHCVARSVQPNNHSWLGKSAAPYTDWTWNCLDAMIHAPVVLKTGDEWIVAGRSQVCDLPEGTVEPDSGHHTSLWAIRNDKAEHLLTVPSAGDTSYCGLAFGPEGEVAMSYYSQHERMPLPKVPPTPADVFLARIEL